MELPRHIGFNLSTPRVGCRHFSRNFVVQNSAEHEHGILQTYRLKEFRPNLYRILYFILYIFAVDNNNSMFHVIPSKFSRVPSKFSSIPSEFSRNSVGVFNAIPSKISHLCRRMSGLFSYDVENRFLYMKQLIFCALDKYFNY